MTVVSKALVVENSLSAVKGIKNGLVTMRKLLDEKSTMLINEKHENRIIGVDDLHCGVGTTNCLVHGDGDLKLAMSIVIVLHNGGEKAIKITEAIAKEKICTVFDIGHVVAIPESDSNGGEKVRAVLIEKNDPPMPKICNNG